MCACAPRGYPLPGVAWLYHIATVWQWYVVYARRYNVSGVTDGSIGTEVMRRYDTYFISI